MYKKTEKKIVMSIWAKCKSTLKLKAKLEKVDRRVKRMSLFVRVFDEVQLEKAYIFPKFRSEKSGKIEIEIEM